MKKMFIVMAAILYCCITQSFSVPDKTTLGSAKFRTQNQSLQSVDIYCGLGRDVSPSLIYFRVYVNNVLQIDWSIYALGQASANEGDTVKIEISTTPPDGGPVVSVQDNNGTIFSQNDPTINFTTFSFVAQAGQSYYINAIM